MSTVKPRPGFRRLSNDRRPGDCHTIPSFCRSNAISPAKYYELKRDGRGPREIELTAGSSLRRRPNRSGAARVRPRRRPVVVKS